MYRSLGFVDVDAQAKELASYAGQLMEDEVVRRMPGILNQIQPSINAAATKAMRSAMQDEAFKQAISSTEGKVATYALVGGIGLVLGTSLLTWYLVK